MGYRILWLPWGGASEAPPPKKSRKESFLTPCCYIAFFTWYIQGSHAKNQPEISKFEQDFRISKFCENKILHHLDIQKNQLDFEDTGLKFYMQA